MMTMRLFMIGFWTEGMLHFSKLAPYIVSFEAAEIQATVYRLPIGFPVLVNQPTQNVSGQLIEINYDQTLISLIDTLHAVHPTEPHKGLHVRQTVQVKKSSGLADAAEVYFFNPKKLSTKAQIIPDAAWKQNMLELPSLPETLTEKQRAYVLKLGSVKGRDIVPINDLTLYRELMKLELIVDKGRRLALTNLGKEVYSHLL